MEITETLKSFVELSDFFSTYTAVLGEESKGLGILVHLLNVGDVLVYGVESFLLRGRGE